MKTFISKLSNNEIKVRKVSINDDIEKVHEFLMDGSVDVKLRIAMLYKYYKKHGEAQCTEIISRITTMYQFSGTKILEKYLYEICTKSKISPFLKITSAKSLCSFDPKKEIGYKALDTVCQDMTDVATPCKIDAICLLMCHKSYKINARNYFCIIINNQELECDYRYKTILSLENKKLDEQDYFIHESMLEFFCNNSNRTLYRILAGQYLIQKCNISQDEKENLEITIMSFSQDPELDYNLRADAADVILSLGSIENKIKAREIIMILGRKDGKVKTIFDNAQNVHIDEIEKSVLDALEFLSGIDIKTISNVPGSSPITFEYVKKQIEDELEKSKPEEKGIKMEKYEENKDKINISLNRIYMDRALYSCYNCSLIHILLKIWTYITTHKSETDMKTRLLEELIDMSGTCSSGFSSRLVNVISGFGDFNLSISWRDQIIANFTGRLNARARNITNEEKLQENGKLYNISKYVCDCCDNNLIDDVFHRKKLLSQLIDFQGSVLEEMSLNCNDFAQRKTFLKFFRKNMLGIRQELHLEFKEYIQDTDFDLYFRAAISNYETGGYV